MTEPLLSVRDLRIPLIGVLAQFIETLEKFELHETPARKLRWYLSSFWG